MQKGITIFRGSFCLTVPKNFVDEPFCVSENLWYRKMLGIRGGRGREGVSRFSIDFFCLTVPKLFMGAPFSASLISGIENFYA